MCGKHAAKANSERTRLARAEKAGGGARASDELESASVRPRRTSKADQSTGTLANGLPPRRPLRCDMRF